MHQDGVMGFRTSGEKSRDADTFAQTLVSNKKVSNWICRSNEGEGKLKDIRVSVCGNTSHKQTCHKFGSERSETVKCDVCCHLCDLHKIVPLGSFILSLLPDATCLACDDKI